MDYFDKLVRQIAAYILLGMLVVGGLIGGAMYYGLGGGLSPRFVIAVTALVGIGASVFLSRIIATKAAEPVSFLWKAILHVTPGNREVSAPDLDKSRIGRELVTSLALQVYQMASTEPAAVVPVKGTSALPSRIELAGVMQNFPLPVLIINKEESVVFANPAAANYLGHSVPEITGNNLYSFADLSFSEEMTLEKWLEDCRESKVTASRTWERVKLLLPDKKSKRLFDMSAYYNKNNPAGAETILTFFDKSAFYGREDDGLSFVSLAVHELRTPLTILRGYIEVLEDELSGRLTPELDSFMKKMRYSAEQLSTFVSNILNVARVEENQLFLQLREESWEKVLKQILNDMELRTRVHNKQLQFNIQPGLPSVAVDKVSIYEALSNLVDNAIKYSDKSNRIIIRAYLRNDGMVETTVQDFGIGIPANIIGNLFEKFYRNHRSRASVGGTGLGLYLSRAIVKAHGGEIWVKSKEGQGSVFGFSLQPYAQLADSLKSTDNKNIQRVAYGWIKNHSFYRR